MLNSIIKGFFRITKSAVYRTDYAPVTYRKGMNFLTGLLPQLRRLDVTYIQLDEQLEAAWIKTQKSTVKDVILYLHGGGYGMGSIQTHLALCGHLAAHTQSQVLSIAYRLAPEHPYPAALEDSIKAYQWLLNQGYTSKQITISGDSAGGGLGLATLMKIRDLGLPQPLCGVLLSPWLDLTHSAPNIEKLQKLDPFIDSESVRIWGKQYAGEHLTDPYASPLWGNPDNLPPLLIQVGTDEVLLPDSERYVSNAKAQEAPVELQIFPHMIHVFQVFYGILPQATQAVKQIGIYIEHQRKVALKLTPTH